MFFRKPAKQESKALLLKNSNSNILDEIPPEVLSLIFSFLSMPNVFTVRGTNKTFNLIGSKFLRDNLETLDEKLFKDIIYSIHAVKSDNSRTRSAQKLIIPLALVPGGVGSLLTMSTMKENSSILEPKNYAPLLVLWAMSAILLVLSLAVLKTRKIPEFIKDIEKDSNARNHLRKFK